jgi:hypothetical protein
MNREFYKILPLVGLLFINIFGQLYPQTMDKINFLKIFEKIDQDRDWAVVEGPKSVNSIDSIEYDWDLKDHLIRFNSRDILESVFIDERDSSLFEVEIISLPSQIEAFGLYSMDKSPSLEFYNIGFETYIHANKIVTWYGEYVLFSEDTDTLEDSKDHQIELMEDLVKYFPKQRRRTPILGCLPSKNKVEHSDKFYMGHWLGQDFFKKVYYADYSTSEGYSRIFIIDNTNTASADTNFWNYYKIFEQNSAVLNDTLNIDTDYFVINEPLWGKAILAKKNHIIYGILDFRSRDWTEEQMADLLEELKDKKIVKSG